MTKRDFEALQQALQVQRDPKKVVSHPSTAGNIKEDPQLAKLLLPESQRRRLPLTKDKYLVRENPRLVQWEREVRKFLKKMSPNSGHRVTAVMVFEWATGLEIKQMMEEGQNPTGHLRQINQILKFYFGDSYTTWIAGRKVGKAYRVKPGFYIKWYRPMTLTLWVEYREGTLSA